MYKRRAQILFLGRNKACLELACELSTQLVADYLQAHCLEINELEADTSTQHWADLLLALDKTACEVLEGRVTAIPYRCWDIPEDIGLARETLSQALLSMAGGMRMMQGQED